VIPEPLKFSNPEKGYKSVSSKNETQNTTGEPRDRKKFESIHYENCPGTYIENGTSRSKFWELDWSNLGN